MFQVTLRCNNVPELKKQLYSMLSDLGEGNVQTEPLPIPAIGDPAPTLKKETAAQKKKDKETAAQTANEKKVKAKLDKEAKQAEIDSEELAAQQTIGVPTEMTPAICSDKMMELYKKDGNIGRCLEVLGRFQAEKLANLDPAHFDAFYKAIDETLAKPIEA